MLLLPIFIILVGGSNLLFLLFFDSLPPKIPKNIYLSIVRPWFPVIGVAISETIALLLVYQMWNHRDRLKEKYGERSYQKIFPIGFAGICMMLSLTVHSFLSIIIWDGESWNELPLDLLSNHLGEFFPECILLFYMISIIASFFSTILGILIILRALSIFGFDYMAVIYLYFPEESELQDHKIYSILRHPTYLGACLICLGGALFQLNIYGLIFFLTYLVGFYIHIRLVEEKELIQRFGESFLEYRKEVPALLVRPRKIGKFLKILFGFK